MLSDFVGTSHLHAVSLVFAATAALQALVAIWAATSRQHWFWRALAVWAAVMALAPVRAYEPAMTFAISSPLTAGLVMLQQRRNERWTRFTIRDLALFMVIVGLSLVGVLHLASHIQRPIVANFALNVSALTAVSVSAAACVFSNRRRLSVCLLLVTIGVCAGAIPMLGSPPEVADALSELGVGFHRTYFARSVGILLLALGEFAALIVTVLGLAQSSRQGARRALAIFAVALALPLAALCWQMLWLSPLLPPFSTAANHYDRLLEITERIKTVTTLPQTAVVQDEREALIDEVVRLSENANFVPYDPNPNPSRVSVDHYAETAQSL